MTNSIPYFEKLVQFDEVLRHAPAGILVFVLCIAFGYVWRAIKVLPNRFTPLVVMLFGCGFNLALNWKGPERLRFAVGGFIIGFAAWVVHRLVIKRIEDKFGMTLAEDDTTTFTKAITPKDDYDPNQPKE